MPPVLESLIPVFLVIVLGWGVRAAGFVGAEQWNGFEKVTYYVLIPALVITTLAMADVSNLPVLALGTTLFVPTLMLSLALFATRTRLQKALDIDGPAFTSVMQGSVRWNSFVAIALAGSLHGKEGVALTAVAFAFLIPLANVVSAYALARHGTHARPLDAPKLALGLLRNPFIWSTLIGIALAAVRPPIPTSIAAFGDIVGRSALAAGLLLVGAGLDLRKLSRPAAALWLASALKLLAMPALAIVFGHALGLAGTSMSVAVICASVPTAAASYILARQAGGDATLMASIVTAQTLLAAVTMPLFMTLAAP